MTKQPFTSLDDLMREEEDRLTAKAHAEIAAEKAAWDALPPEEQAERIRQIEAKYDDLMLTNDDDEPVPCSGCGDPDCDFDCDGDYDAEDDE